MLRKVIAVLASMLLVGSFGAVPALAGHGGDFPPQRPHEAPPTDKGDFGPVAEGECNVDGTVVIDNQNANGGVDTVPRHNHYDFVDADMECLSETNAFLNQVFSVEADGGTDGEGVSAGHGETVANGWSHDSDYDDGSIADRDAAVADNCEGIGDGSHRGDIYAVSKRGDEASGLVKFIRVGTQVEAWGCLSPHDPTEPDIFFEAELAFIPFAGQIGGTVTNADLVGRAVVGQGKV